MKKKLFLLFIGFVIFVGGAAAENIDVIVMVDITWSLYESYDDIEQYLLGALLDEVLHNGDTFHLIRFSNDTHVEITEVIRDKKTTETIRIKLSQLKNLRWQYGHYTNLLKAVSDLISFTEARPKENKKVVILITDGIHDPAPGTETPPNSEELKKRFLEQAELIKKQGWKMHILRIPGATDENGNPLPGTENPPFFEIFKDNENSDITNYTSEDSKDLLPTTAGFTQITFPGDLGNVGEKFLIPFKVKNNSDREMTFQLNSVLSGQKNILTEPVEITVSPQSENSLSAIVTMPDTVKPGKNAMPLSLEFAGNEIIVSKEGTISFTFVPGTPPNYGISVLFSSIVLWILPGIGILILLVLLLLFLRIRGIDNPFRRFLGAGRTRKTSYYSTQVKNLHANSNHSFAIEMIVSLQKRQIGHRNIHRIPKGKAMSVGGKRSAFLIFLVPVPGKIAKIHFDGTSFTFTPRKKEYFPGIDGPVYNCLETEISARSKKGYEFTVKFEHYISPLEKINAIFHSVKNQAANS